MQYTSRNLKGLLLAGLLALAASGCAKDKTDDTPVPGGTGGGGKTTKSDLKIAVIPKGTAASFWQSIKQGADAAGKEEGVTIEWDGPDVETNIEAQVNLVQNKANSGVAGIVIAPTDREGLVPPVEAAIKKGIPVVAIDSSLATEQTAAYIATDNVEGGRKAADALAKSIGEQGKVGLLPFKKGAGSSDDREKGFLEQIKKYPNIQVLEPLYIDSDTAKAVDQTTNMITANPDLKGIFACNEPGGIGSANVLKQLGKTGQIKIVAYDTSPEEIKALEEGVIDALIVQDPYQMGYQGVKIVLKAIRKQPIEKKFVDSGVMVVTKENLSKPEVQKLINPTGAK